HLTGGLLLAVGGTAVGMFLLEIGIRFSGVEGQVSSRALYLQNADLSVHRVSSDPFLHYELAPETQHRGKDKQGKAYSVSIDAFGARNPTHAQAKAPGTFRILCFGGSTMYGAAVDDEQTIPARLERHLNR